MNATSAVAGKTYIVTGASRGIGLAAATALVKRGARVALFGRDTEALARSAATLGPGTHTAAFDIADRKALLAAIEDAVGVLGGLDGLINNAGVCMASPVEQLDADEVALQVNVNFLAPVYACQAVIPHFRKRGGGRILNVTSASAHHMDEFSYLGIYSATKAALERFTKELREELKGENIGVTAFSPGGTETSFGSGWRPEIAAAAFAEWIRRAEMFDGGLAVNDVGEAIANCLELPPGAAFDFVELRPVKPMNRAAYAESLYAARRDNP